MVKFSFFCKTCDRDLIVSERFYDVQQVMQTHGQKNLHGGTIYCEGKMIMDNTEFVEEVKAIREGKITMEEAINKPGMSTPRKLTAEELKRVREGERKARERAKDV